MTCHYDWHWPSTKGLSVYNTLVEREAAILPIHEARQVMAADGFLVDDEYVEMGLQFLTARGLVRLDSGCIHAVHRAKNGLPARLKRTNNDADLAVKVKA